MPSIDEVWFFTSEIENERAGSFRQERWCKVLLETGVRVTIYNVKDAGPLKLTEVSFTSEEEFLAFRHKSIAEAIPSASIREGLMVRGLRHIKHLFLADLYYPNIIFLILRVRRKLVKSGKRVVIMSSSPPFSLALAGAVLKALRPQHVVLAIDMRDSWTSHRSLGGIRIIRKHIERIVLRMADFVSTVSYGLRDELQQMHSINVHVFYNIATHYFNVGAPPSINWTALNPSIAVGKIKLIYTGSAPENYYDLAALVGAVKSLRVRTPELADKIQLIFVGACAEVQREIKRQDFAGDDIVFIPHVAHEMARAIQQNADILLYLTYLGKGAVSTKIFEYFALGKPIFPVSVPKDSDADRLLTTYCGASCNLYSAEDIFNVLQRVVQDGGLASMPKVTEPLVIYRLLDDYKRYANMLLSK